MAKNEVATNEVQLPAYIKQNTNRGNENVSTEDIQLPRIEVLQALSPQIKKSNAAYIEGAEVGMLFNTLTHEVYADCVGITPVTFTTRYLVWVDRKIDNNGGLRGVYDTEQEALAFVAQQADKDKLEVVRTAEHLVLLDDGTEAILSMSKSKQKASRKFNSLIRLNGGDRFSRRYELFSYEDSSAKGEFMNIDVANAGFPSEDIYYQAESIYENVNAGNRQTQASYTDMQDEGVERY